MLATLQLSIYSRAMVLISASLAAVTFAMTFLTIREKEAVLTSELQSRIGVLAEQSAISIRDAVWTLNRTGARVVLQGVTRDPDFLSASVVDDKGRLFVLLGAENVEDSQVESRQVPIVIDGSGNRQEIGLLSLVFSLDRLQRMKKAAAWDAFVLGLWQLAAVLAATAIALRAVTRSLGAINDRMLKVAHGELEQSVPYTERRDQIGEIARAVENFRVESIERRRAEQALKRANDDLEHRVAERTRELSASEERLRDAVESISEGFVIYNADDRLVMCNAKYGELYHRSVDVQEIGILFEDLIRRGVERGEYPQALGREEEWLQERLAQHRNPGGVVEQQLSDGRWLQITDRRMKNGGTAGLRMDITEQKRAQAALLESEAREREARTRLEMLLNRMPIGCILTDSELRQLYWNPAAERIFGYRFEEVAGRGPFETGILADDRATIEAKHEQHRRGNMSASTISNNLTKDGRKIKCEWHNTPILGPDGKFQGVLAMCQDITERSRAEEETRRAQTQEREMRQQLETILNRMPLGCILFDAEFRATYLNPAAETIFGYRAEEVLMHDPLSLIVPDSDRPTVEAQRAHRRRGDMAVLSHAPHITKDGRNIVCECHHMPLLGQDGAFLGMIGLYHDVTERLKTDEALRQSQKMEAVGQLTGGVAHDFNNLLTVIMANLELLKFTVDDDPGGGAMIAAALGAATRGAELTHQLLAFSRRQTLEPNVIEVNELVDGMIRLLSRTLGENIEVDLSLGTELWPVLADPTQLESVLTNLAVNARDAMPEGGKLTIETMNVSLDESYAAQNPEVVPGDYVVLVVSDTGTGMPPEVAAKVFEPFFTTKAPGKGTGLGLSMVFGFVKQSGGHIKIYSEIGQGTTIRLYLPRTEAEAGAIGAPQAVETVAAAKTGEVVLLVEDEGGVRQVVAKHLSHFGYRVLQAPNGPAALDLLDRNTKIDLLFTDLVMPGGMNGVDLAEQARAKRPKLKLLFTSGYSEPTLLSKLTRIKGAVLLVKPFKMVDLARKIREVIDGRQQPAATRATIMRSHDGV